MRKGRIKRTLLWMAAAVVGLLALLVYTFTPAKLDVAAYPESVFQASAPDPSSLPETHLSLIECMTASPTSLASNGEEPAGSITRDACLVRAFFPR